MDLWRMAWRSRAFKIEAAVTLLGIPVLAAVCLTVFPLIQNRQGVILNDPLFAFFHPVNMDWPTFGILYSAVAVGLVHGMRDPRRLFAILQVFLVVQFIRVLTICVTPLDPPLGKIPLRDPFLYSCMKDVFTKDLFFSGHTATCFLLLLLTREKWPRCYLVLATVGVACCVLATHGHYTIDVLAAFPFTYLSYRFVTRFRRRHCWPQEAYAIGQTTSALLTRWRELRLKGNRSSRAA